MTVNVYMVIHIYLGVLNDVYVSADERDARRVHDEWMRESGEDEEKNTIVFEQREIEIDTGE